VITPTGFPRGVAKNAFSCRAPQEYAWSSVLSHATFFLVETPGSFSVKALREKHFAEVGFSLPVSASARRDQRAPCRAATTQNGRLFYGGEARCAAGGTIEVASAPVHSRNVAPGQPEDWAELQKLGTGVTPMSGR
jgi:hypothetical protein